MLNGLKELIEQSRNWASVDRGRTLFVRVAQVLQEIFGIESGMIVYQKQFTPDEKDSGARIYEPWGLAYSETQLTQFISDGAWFKGEPYLISERWQHVSEGPPVWRRIWSEANIKYVGAWPIIAKKGIIGAIVLGRKTTPDENDADIMSACATYVSLILEMLRLRRIAEHASLYDPLTNILNRRGFTEKLTDLSNESKMHLIIGIVDINDFKEINDNQGHAAGDFILSDVAEVIKNNIIHHGICARFGGDEFVFVFETENPNVEENTSYVASWFTNKDYSVSIGCSILGIDGHDWGSCLHVADKRMYEGKTSILK